MSDCVVTVVGRCTQRHFGDDGASDCCQRSLLRSPAAPEYKVTITNPDDGVIASSAGEVTLIKVDD